MAGKRRGPLSFWSALLRAAVYGPIVASALVLSYAYAATYVYDANGRLRAVTSDAGVSSEYVYDALGNILSINSITPGQVAIFSFIPNHGPPGTIVKVSGTGFSSTPSANLVSFNGASAVVLSADANELLVTVPPTATSGLIAATVAASTTVSADNFTVTNDSGGQPPTIALFAPSIANAGDSVTVTGAHFISSAGSTQAGVNTVAVTVMHSSDTQLSFDVPSQTGSGPVMVATPYGRAQSTQVLTVVPAAVGAANVVANDALTIGAVPRSMTIDTAGKHAVATFSGMNGQWLSLQFSQFSITPTGGSITVSVYDPAGNSFAAGTISPTTMSVHMPPLPMIGTYTIVCTPPIGTAQFDIAVELNQAVGMAGTSSIATSSAGQSKRVIFAGLAHQYLGLYMPAMSITPATANIYEAAYGPIGEQLTTSPPYRASEFLNLPPFTETGFGSAVFLPASNVTAFSAQLQLASNAVGDVEVDGTALSQTTSYPGEYAYFMFEGTSGSNLSIGLADLSVTAGGTYVHVTVFQPDRTVIVSTTCVIPGCHFVLPALAQTGVYRVQLGAGSTFSVASTLNTITGGSLNVGSTQPIELNRRGQIARLTFNGTAGQYLGLYLTNVSTAPSGGNVYISLKNPDGTTVGGATANTTSSHFLNLPKLSQTGAYTVQVEAQYANTATAQLTLVENTVDHLTVNGPSVTQSPVNPGEFSYLMFDATAGQSMSLGLSGVSTSTAGYVYYKVFQPNGSFLLEGSCYAQGCHRALTGLVQTGTYLVSFSPSGGVQNQTYSVTTTISTDITGSLTADVPYAVNLQNPGQMAQLTFTGTAGQYFGLYLTNVSTTPSGGNVYISLKNPSGTAVSGGSTNTTSNYFLNLPKLAQTGTYTVQVEAQYANTATAQLMLVENTVDHITVNGSSVTQSPGNPGESSYLMFDATAGQSISMGLSGVSTSTTGYVYYKAYQPNGSFLLEGSCYAPGCHRALGDLAQTGTYVVAFSPSGGVQNQTFSVTTTISTDITGSMTVGVPYSVSLQNPGQMARLTFTSAAGQYFGLHLTNVSTTPSGGNVYIGLKNPGGAAVSGGSANTTSSYFLNLPKLTQTGTYTVQVEAQYANTAVAELMLVENPVDQVAVNGSTVTQSPTSLGENAYVLFEVSAGQGVRFALTNVSTTPSGGYVYSTVYKPDGSYLYGNSCYGVTCTSDSIILPVAGTYVIKHAPSGGAQNQSFSASTAVISP